MNKEDVLADVKHILTTEEFSILANTQAAVTRFEYLQAGCAFVAACKHLGFNQAEIADRCELFHMGTGFPFLYQAVVLAARPHQIEQLKALRLA